MIANIFSNRILFILMGMFVLSPLCSELTIKYLHLPFAAPELLFIPFYYLLDFNTLKLNKKVFFGLFILIVLLFIFAVLAGEFSLFAILSNARVWLYLFITLSLYIDNNIDYEYLMFLSYGSLLGWAIICYLNFGLQGSLAGGDFIVTYGVMLSIPIFIVLVFYLNNRFLLVSGIFLISIIIALAGIRRVMVIVAISLIVYAIIVSSKNKMVFFRFLFFISSSAIIFIIVLPMIENAIKDVSHDLHYRVFTRTQNFITDGFSSNSDQLRLKNFEDFYNNFWNYTLPNGFISHNTSNDNVGYFNDFPLLQLCWIFGWPLAFFFVLYFAFIMIKNYYLYNKYKNVKHLVSFISILIILVMLFLEGAFLTFVYATPMTGFTLANAINNARSK